MASPAQRIIIDWHSDARRCRRPRQKQTASFNVSKWQDSGYNTAWTFSTLSRDRINQTKFNATFWSQLCRLPQGGLNLGNEYGRVQPCSTIFTIMRASRINPSWDLPRSQPIDPEFLD